MNECLIRGGVPPMSSLNEGDNKLDFKGETVIVTVESGIIVGLDFE